MVLSEDVQRAAFEGDLETITAWMASNDVNDTVVAPAARCPCCRILGATWSRLVISEILNVTIVRANTKFLTEEIKQSNYTPFMTSIGNY